MVGVWGGERMATMDLSLRRRLVRVGSMGLDPDYLSLNPRSAMTLGK